MAERAEKKLQYTSAINLTYTAMFTTLIAAGAFIKIPVPVVPFTLQFLFTMRGAAVRRKGRSAQCSPLYDIRLGRASDFCGRRRALVPFKTQLRLYHRFLSGKLCNWKNG